MEFVKKYLLAICFLFLTLQIYPSFAAGSEFYIGGSLGYSKIDNVNDPATVAFSRAPSSTFDIALIPFLTPRASIFALAPVITNSSTSVDDSGINREIFGGYFFTQSFGVEAGYVSLGSKEEKRSITFLPSNTVSSSEKIKFNGFQLMGIGKHPITNKLYLFGKIGAARWNTNTNISRVSSIVPSSFSTSDNGINMSFGIGAGFQITENIGIRTEWEQNRSIENEISTNVKRKHNINTYNFGVYYLLANPKWIVFTSERYRA
ncbi:MAG: OOP family OmpA-OmpF porin [Planctomycetota bacterium]|jgi:OOP family OmpA-OmpF porin